MESQIRTKGSRPWAFGFLTLGDRRAKPKRRHWLHVWSLVDPCCFLVTRADCRGFARFHLPKLPVILPEGAKISGQFFWFDSWGCRPLNASNALEITVQK